MKNKFLFSALLIVMGISVFAQSTDDDAKSLAATNTTFASAKDTAKRWDYGGSLALNLGQTYLLDWASGGQNALSVAFTGLAHADYRHKKWMWDNNLVLGLGGIALFPQEKYKDPMDAYPFRKNVDNLQLTSAAGYQIDSKGKLFASALMDFRTSLIPGYGNYAYDSTADGGKDPVGKINSRQKISAFAAPAYLTLSLGVTYKPFSWLSFYLAPVAGKFTFVNPKANIYNENGADTTQPVIGATAYGLKNATDKYRAEFGWYFRANVEKEVVKNVIIKSQIELWDNYLDKNHADNIAATPGYYDPATQSGNRIIGTDPTTGLPIYGYDDRKYIDVNWQTWITFKINKYLQASLEWQLLYDHDIAVPKYEKPDPTTGVQAAYSGRGVQFREGFTLGLGYMF